jgi:hypothetical protein
MLSKHVNNLLSAYHHGELASAETRRVAAHLSQCQACRAEYDAIKSGAQLAQLLRREAAPPGLWAQVEAGLDTQTATNGTRRSLFGWFAGLGWPQLVMASATAVLLIGLGGFWFYTRLYRPSWEVEALAGLPRIGAQVISKAGRLRVGEWLLTDHTAKARISVGAIGEVEIEPNSQVQLVAARATEHRLALQRGKLTATISAPPRFFFVNTPSATAVDLGCIYTLEVDESGQGTLRVTVGWVAFEERGIESFVPEEAMCITRPVLGPGTPYFEDASPALQAALARFDVEQSSAEARAVALEEVLREARARDGLTLWHLLSRTNATERNRVFDRMSALIPPPSEVTREGILRGERTMLDAWWEKLELGSPSWWRLWKAPLPSTK